MIDRNTIWYHILIDRFAGYDKSKDDAQPIFVGGNIKGIIDKIPYLKDLGVDVLLLSPFNVSAAYHGYHITDYERIDPHFGTWHDVQSLIKISHQQGIKVIADFVSNHCSKHHPYFIDAQSDRTSNYRKWFYFKKWPNNYLCFLSYKELPKFNLSNNETALYFLNIALEWCRLGFDGIRIDHLIGLPDNFVKKLVGTLKAVNPDFFVVGEAWAGSIRHKHKVTLQLSGKHSIFNSKFIQENIQLHYQGLIHGIFDFEAQHLITASHQHKISIEHVKLQLHKHYNKYTEQLILPCFLDNHDLNRYYFLCRKNKKHYIDVLKLMLNQNQPFVFYYGSEIALSQNGLINSKKAHSDLNVRQKMPWGEHGPLTDEIKELIHRKKMRK